MAIQYTTHIKRAGEQNKSSSTITKIWPETEERAKRFYNSLKSIYTISEVPCKELGDTPSDWQRETTSTSLAPSQVSYNDDVDTEYDADKPHEAQSTGSISHTPSHPFTSNPKHTRKAQKMPDHETIHLSCQTSRHSNTLRVTFHQGQMAKARSVDELAP